MTARRARRSEAGARRHDAQVRADLARKISRLAPGLTAEEQDAVRRMTYETLALLAHDQLPTVRHILAEALKSEADAPPELIRRLARDIEIIVAAPVLEFSPVLTDEDLMDIIRASPAVGALRRAPGAPTCARESPTPSPTAPTSRRSSICSATTARSCARRPWIPWWRGRGTCRACTSPWRIVRVCRRERRAGLPPSSPTLLAVWRRGATLPETVARSAGWCTTAGRKPRRAIPATERGKTARSRRKSKKARTCTTGKLTEGLVKVSMPQPTGIRQGGDRRPSDLSSAGGVFVSRLASAKAG